MHEGDFAGTFREEVANTDGFVIKAKARYRSVAVNTDNTGLNGLRFQYLKTDTCGLFFQRRSFCLFPGLWGFLRNLVGL